MNEPQHNRHATSASMVSPRQVPRQYTGFHLSQVFGLDLALYFLCMQYVGEESATYILVQSILPMGEGRMGFEFGSLRPNPAGRISQTVFGKMSMERST